MISLRTLSGAVLLGSLTLSSGLMAQDMDPEKMKKNREDKLAKPFAKNAPWLLDLDKAKAAAKEGGKPIFVYMTRSFAP